MRLVNNQLDKSQNKLDNDEIFYFAQSYLKDTNIPQIIQDRNSLKAKLAEKDSFKGVISIKQLINLENTSNIKLKKIY